METFSWVDSLHILLNFVTSNAWGRCTCSWWWFDDQYFLVKFQFPFSRTHSSKERFFKRHNEELWSFGNYIFVRTYVAVQNTRQKTQTSDAISRTHLQSGQSLCRFCCFCYCSCYHFKKNIWFVNSYTVFVLAKPNINSVWSMCVQIQHSILWRHNLYIFPHIERYTKFVCKQLKSRQIFWIAFIKYTYVSVTTNASTKIR